MINPKRVIRMAGLMQKRMPFSKAANGVYKGRFAVYTCDEIRFVMPLSYLKNDMFQEVLKVAEDEYGLQTDGPIRLPFEATFMKYMVSLMERCVCNDIEKALLTSIIASERCLSDSNCRVEREPQVPLSSF